MHQPMSPELEEIAMLSEEVLERIWVARDGNGSLFTFTDRPTIVEGVWRGRSPSRLDSSEYRNIKPGECREYRLVEPEKPTSGTVPPVVGHQFRCRGGDEVFIDRLATVKDGKDSDFKFHSDSKTGGFPPFWLSNGQFYGTAEHKYDLVEDLGPITPPPQYKAGSVYRTTTGKLILCKSHRNSGGVSSTSWVDEDGKPWSWGCTSTHGDGTPVPVGVKYRSWRTEQEVPEIGTKIISVAGTPWMLKDVLTSRSGELIIEMRLGNGSQVKRAWRGEEDFHQRFVLANGFPCGVPE